MSYSPPETSPPEEGYPPAAISGAGELDAEGTRPARPRRRRGRRGGERGEARLDEGAEETTPAEAEADENSVVDVEPDLAAAQPVAETEAQSTAPEEPVAETTAAPPTARQEPARAESELPPPTPAPTPAHHAEATRDHGRSRGQPPSNRQPPQARQLGDRGPGRQQGGRPQALPPGVPSAAALDELEPARGHAQAAPRQEPQGDLALLLRGFEEIQQRSTDRLLSAMRQTGGSDGQVARTTATTERIGVFVDVPNLVYAARYLNRWIDFGRLLERLLGGRRLIRAHAYSPTDPDPSAEQQFLTPVKSQGYRLTTKNYRTFASGAKKADMDLDLCMDVVRLVVAKAIDCVVLCSGDGDFSPLLDFCSDNGVRVEVASFIEATSDELRQACDRFYNLSAMEGIRLSRPLGTSG